MSRGTIAVVSDSGGYGGAELYLATVVEHLRERWRFAALIGDQADAETHGRLEEAGADVLVVRGLRRKSDPTAVLRTVWALKDVDPALVHVNLTDQGDGLGAMAAARLARRRLVATLHLFIPGRASWRDQVSSVALRLPRSVMCVASSVAEDVTRAGGRATVVLNGIAPPVFAPTPRAALGLAETDFVVGGLGRLDPQKGWDLLCRVAGRVREEVPDAVFVVLGDGPERGRLEGIRECANVRFLGYRERASSLLKAFDVLVMPSRYEAFPFVAIEAMHAGVPIVATEVGGLAEALDGCGVLVPPERDDLLAEALIGLASDPQARGLHSERGIARARTLFSVDRMIAETERVYETLA